MRTKFKMTLYLLLGCAFLIAPSRSLADGTDGFADVFDIFFGSQAARDNLSSCSNAEKDEDDGKSDRGFLGSVQGFFCHMKVDMGINGVGNVTKTFTKKGRDGQPDTTVYVHAEIAKPAGGATVSGVTYDYEAKVWTCLNGCTTASAFGAAAYAAFSKTEDGGTNKGILAMDPGNFEGRALGNTMFVITYDLGNATATQTFVGKAYFNVNSREFLMRGDAKKSMVNGDKILSVQMLMDMVGTGEMRFDGKLDETAKTGAVYLENSQASGDGVSATVQTSVKGDTPANPVCFSFDEKSGDRDDTYTADSGTCSMTLDPFSSAEDLNDVANYTHSSIAPSQFTSMGTPSSI